MFLVEFWILHSHCESVAWRVANVKSTPLVWLWFRSPHDRLAEAMMRGLQNRHTSSFGTGTPRGGLFPLIRAFFGITRGARLSSQVGGADPEHFGLRILGVEPEKIRPRIGCLERSPAAANLAQQAAFRRQVPLGLVHHAADGFEPVRAAVESKLRLGAALARQSGHAFRIDIGRVGYDQIVTLAANRPKQV